MNAESLPSLLGSGCGRGSLTGTGKGRETESGSKTAVLPLGGAAAGQSFPGAREGSLGELTLLRGRKSWPQGQPIYHGEFDPGSERTLAARFTHASRTAAVVAIWQREWQTGE